MQLKLGKRVYPVKGLLTAFGATLLLISMAVDFSYGNKFYIEFNLCSITVFWFHQGTKYIFRLDIMAYLDPASYHASNATKVEC
jgi:hypothetical protein